MRRATLSRLVRDRRGVSAVEFAFIAPSFFLVLIGTFDFGHTLYMRAALQGTVQKVARDSTLEHNTGTTAQASLDETIRSQVLALHRDADVDIKRRFYRTFSQAAAARAEDLADTNHNKKCDAGEEYEDANNNNVWDADGGSAGQGGARDVTVLTVTVNYPRITPLFKMLGKDGDMATAVATTVLRNQPYGDQGVDGPPVTRSCPA